MKIKFNWGTGIVAAFAFFMGFILFFVIKVQSDTAYDNELVVENYYKQERVLDAKLSKLQNAANRKTKITIAQDSAYIRINFPDVVRPEDITGKVSLYRPSSQKLDFEIPISLSKPCLLIPKSDLAGGRWDITIDWEYEETSYLYNEMLTLE